MNWQKLKMADGYFALRFQPAAWGFYKREFGPGRVWLVVGCFEIYLYWPKD
jgi:hypothetical protein